MIRFLLLLFFAINSNHVFADTNNVSAWVRKEVQYKAISLNTNSLSLNKISEGKHNGVQAWMGSDDVLKKGANYWENISAVQEFNPGEMQVDEALKTIKIKDSINGVVYELTLLSISKNRRGEIVNLAGWKTATPITGFSLFVDRVFDNWSDFVVENLKAMTSPNILVSDVRKTRENIAINCLSNNGQMICTSEAYVSYNMNVSN